MVLHAHVKAGRLIVDEPTDLPEGSVVELVAVDDMMNAAESAALEAAIDEGLAQADRGEAIPADEVLRRLRAQ